MQSNRTRFCLAGIFAAALMIHAAPAGAEEQAGSEQAQAMPSQQQMMAQMAALSQPGPEHAILARMAGTFTASCESYCDPAGPQRFTGTQVNTMILGGRFLQGSYQGQMMGMPFSGMGLSGYDNTAKQFISFWADTMSTNWMTSTGSVDQTGKIISLAGSFDCPIQRAAITLRQVVTFIDDDHYTFEMFGPGPDGTESPMMKIAYTRQ